MLQVIASLQDHDEVALVALVWLAIFGGFEWLTQMGGHLAASAFTLALIVLTGVSLADDVTDLLNATRSRA
jgi:hypothetical protein